MPAERPLPLAMPPLEKAVSERTYREDEVAAIFQRAARLERERGTAEGALSLREIEAIARDSGIEPTMVRQAARELDAGRSGAVSTAIAGAPIRYTAERIVDAEIGAEHHERLTQEIREVLSTSGVGARWVLPGSITSLGRSLILSGFTGTTSVEVNVAPREGKTFIRITADRSQLAGALFGGIIGGVGGGLGANVGWMIPYLLHLPAAAGLAGAGLVVLGAYALARTIFGHSARGLDRKLEDLADRLEAIARWTPGIRPAPPPTL